MRKTDTYLLWGLGIGAVLILSLKPALNFIANVRLNQYQDLITFYAQMYNLPPNLIEAVCLTESSGDSNAVGDYDANGNPIGGGLMGVTLATASDYGYSGTFSGLLDPSTNLNYGCAILADAYKQAGKDPQNTYAIYNDGAVRKNAQGIYINSQGASIQAHIDNFNNNLNSLTV